ncbi:MAG: hypothetical protein KGJ17_02350 [Gammaproteobacteria bacterium]|nr:hypothetical protein [Gammaproteobacteria bacterium]
MDCSLILVPPVSGLRHPPIGADSAAQFEATAVKWMRERNAKHASGRGSTLPHAPCHNRDNVMAMTSKTQCLRHPTPRLPLPEA